MAEAMSAVAFPFKELFLKKISFVNESENFFPNYEKNHPKKFSLKKPTSLNLRQPTTEVLLKNRLKPRVSQLGVSMFDKSYHYIEIKQKPRDWNMCFDFSKCPNSSALSRKNIFNQMERVLVANVKVTIYTRALETLNDNPDNDSKPFFC